MATSAAKLKAAPVPEAAAAPAAPAPGGSRKILFIAAAALVLAAGAGAGGWFWWSAKQAAAESEDGATHAGATKRAPQFVPMDSFTVNLQDENAERYLQVGMILQVADGDTVDAVKRHMPIIRNRVLLLLSSKRSQDLATPEGKRNLAAEIASEARQTLPESRARGESKGVEGVNFASFVIQ